MNEFLLFKIYMEINQVILAEIIQNNGYRAMVVDDTKCS